MGMISQILDTQASMFLARGRIAHRRAAAALGHGVEGIPGEARVEASAATCLEAYAMLDEV